MRIVGARYEGNGRCRFTVWAPLRERVMLRLVSKQSQEIEMKPDDFGYFEAVVSADTGSQYYYVLEEGKGYPDPASQYQPEGVHGPSEVLDHDSFFWTDHSWKGIPFREAILYELHVGTFTDEGTFEAIISRLDDFVALGINTIELMPVAQFPGTRNWGYDGVYPFAVQNSYGGPDGLKKLVNECHQRGIAVFLDVVYNHLGPEGNYLQQFGPYFSNKYGTPWGDAINYDGEWSDGVKEYFIQNILFWYETYHIDGLRLDAIHTIFDNSAINIWEVLSEKKKVLEQKLGRPFYLTAESDLNSPKVMRPIELGGYAFDAQWLDDFHHALYVLLHKQGKDRYEDFGTIYQLAKAYKEGFVHSGEYVKFRKRTHGSSSAGLTGDHFIVFNQNHDQVGNRVGGERLCMLVDMERVKVAAAAILLSPYIPMLFMGEEYGAESPFYYFVSHSDKDLIHAVREGRKKEFENYKWEGEPLDPQHESTYDASKLQWQNRLVGKHNIILNWHRNLISLRRSHPALQNFNKNDIVANVINEESIVLHRQAEGGRQHLLCFLNFSQAPVQVTLPKLASGWRNILNSKERQWMEEAGKEKRVPEYLAPGDSLNVEACSVLVYESETDSSVGK